MIDAAPIRARKELGRDTDDFELGSRHSAVSCRRFRNEVAESKAERTGIARQLFRQVLRYDHIASRAEILRIQRASAQHFDFVRVKERLVDAKRADCSQGLSWQLSEDWHGRGRTAGVRRNDLYPRPRRLVRYGARARYSLDTRLGAQSAHQLGAPGREPGSQVAALIERGRVQGELRRQKPLCGESRSKNAGAKTAPGELYH